MMRESLAALERTVTRRSLFRHILRGTGLVAVYDRFGPGLFGAGDQRQAEDAALQIYGAIGRIVIPVDEDPGWASFEPAINEYGLKVFAGQVFLGGDKNVYDGLVGALNFLNEAPPRMRVGPRFLDMGQDQRLDYYTNAFTGQYERSGMQDILTLAAAFGMISSKAAFFSNFPRHLPAIGAEYQILPASSIKTGWDIMGWKGPVGPDEEKALRDKYYGIEVLPGIDRSNPYI